ncbi:MAG: hypothetical protein K1X78_08205 [Verrucomicrobiaceae bacterium]|nr:hypothetical protein [Verrucomicrobiaceae bacterium]
MKAFKHRLRLVVPMALVTLGFPGTGNTQVVPTTPKGFKMRQIGENGASAGIASTPKPAETSYRMVTYIALSPSRQWKSADGRSLLGKLIAFEDIVVQTKNAVPDTKAPPPMPATITVVRDGKARLLVDSRPFEIALERLGEDERSFVKTIESGMKAKESKRP